jgi:hypothetical protein
MDDQIKRPPSFKLDAEQAAAFAAITKRQTDLGSRQAAVQQFLKTVVQSGEARMTELHSDTMKLHADLQALWVKVKSVTGADLDNIDYNLSEDGTEIVPVAMKL